VENNKIGMFFLSLNKQNIYRFRNLDVAREEHDADWCTETLGWEIFGKLGSYSAAVAVMSGDLTPDASELRSLLFCLGLVNVSNFLT
jgi:hypothetical protein